MKKSIYIISAFVMLFCSACNKQAEAVSDPIAFTERNITSQISPFVDEDGNPTKVNMDGDQFESGDMIRLRVIAPFTSGTEYGEATWRASFDNWYLLEWGGADTDWTTIPNTRGFDINGDFAPSTAPGLTTLSQATPYVFTATTWTEEIHFQTMATGGTAENVVTTFSNVFKADQRLIANYKSSDVLWAQTYMQTCTGNVRLDFQHKMSSLVLDISEFASLLTGSEPVVVTLENMPDIDQQEVVIGNYYAARIKPTPEGRANFSEKVRSACTYENNGKVLGIVVADLDQNKFVQMSFESLARTATYTAYTADPSSYSYQLIIPPYTVPGIDVPTVVIRQGEKKWSAHLSLPVGREFKSGVRYTVKVTKPTI